MFVSNIAFGVVSALLENFAFFIQGEFAYFSPNPVGPLFLPLLSGCTKFFFMLYKCQKWSHFSLRLGSSFALFVLLFLCTSPFLSRIVEQLFAIERLTGADNASGLALMWFCLVQMFLTILCIVIFWFKTKISRLKM